MTRILTREGINRMVGNSRSAQGSQFSRGGGGGGGQAVSLANLSDVAISTPIDGGSVLTFDETAGKWVAGPDVLTTMWDALSATGTEQIDASHLTGVLGDYATETWVSQNYISIAYFDRLFRAYNGDNLVNHNDETSTIDNIKAMFGFWTEQYLSALGNSGGGSVSLTLANMGDVSLTTPSANQVLLYDGTTSKWINSGLKTINGQSIYGTGDIEVGGGGTGYLPLTGGTMAGDINFNRASPAYNSDGVIWGNSAFIGCDTSNGLGIYAKRIYLRPNSSKGSSSGLGVAIDSSNVTYNGYTIWHEGNFTPSNYLPLAGGTMTGSLELTQGIAITSEGYAMLVYKPSSTTGVTSSQWGAGATNSQGVIRSDASDLLHWRGSGSSGQAYAILDEYNATNILNDSYLPLSGGSVSGNITPSANASYNLGSSSLWWNRLYTRYIDTASGYNLRLCTAGTERLIITALSGNVGIGTTSPNYKLHVNGTLGAGNTSVANLESEGYVSALSDIRKKDVVEYMDGLTIEQIADAPIIKFAWKDRPEDGLQVGSIAQYWQDILPQSVHTTHDGFLSFAESRAALIGTISNSRKLVDHEQRIAELERENKELKLKLNIA